MAEAIVKVVSSIIFGKEFLDGYMPVPENKDEFELVSLFPNDVVKKEVTNVLRKSANKIYFS